MDKIIEVCGFSLKATEYKTDPNEQEVFGESVYIIDEIPCALWEETMPDGTIRGKEFRDVDVIWGAFIRNNQANLRTFISRLSQFSGHTLLLASKYTLPPSVYQLLKSYCIDFYEDGSDDTSISLVFYNENRLYLRRCCLNEHCSYFKEPLFDKEIEFCPCCGGKLYPFEI